MRDAAQVLPAVTNRTRLSRYALASFNIVKRETSQRAELISYLEREWPDRHVFMSALSEMLGHPISVLDTMELQGVKLPLLCYRMSMQGLAATWQIAAGFALLGSVYSALRALASQTRSRHSTLTHTDY